MLVLTQTEVDTTGQSYFGETNLYFLDAQGKYDCRITLGTCSLDFAQWRSAHVRPDARGRQGGTRA